MVKIIKFEKGPGNKKYTAILSDGKRVNFGDKRYQQYHDKIGMYSHLDHNDPKRREAYRARHSKILSNGTPAYKKKYSSSWFSYNYLW